MSLPLFPLNTVLFPGCILDLQIFEARYLDMIGRCMKQGGGFGVKPSNFTKPGGVDGITRAAKVDGDPCAWVDLEVKGCGGVGVEDVLGQWLCPACATVSKDYWAREAAAK